MENFKIVDLKDGQRSDNHKKYYYAVIYSDLEYLVTAFLTEEDYKFLKSVDYFNYDLSVLLKKRYNRTTDKFSYYINLK